MSSPKVRYKPLDIWGYKLEIQKGTMGFIVFVPPNVDISKLKKLGFTPTEFSHKHYTMWVALAKGRRADEIVSFFKRQNISLLAETEIVNCFPFRSPT